MAIANQDLGQLIEQARDVSAERASRHHAFEQIVRRFQDLVFACACARLRDAALAEDAAQDAFLLAWERLGQLREPAAFPGWIRRLVLTQCNRRLRVRRLQLRPEDEASGVAGPCDPAADMEAGDEATLVRIALARLAPHDRLVLILFYGSERTHEQIAEWLGIPVTTVARRLAHARRRLRRQTLAGVSSGLRAQHTAARDAFVMELSSRLRRAEPDDAAAIERLACDLRLDRAPSVAVHVPCGYVVEDPASGRPIAYAAAVQTIFTPIYDLQLAIGAGALKRHAGDVLLAQVVQELLAGGAVALQHRTSTRHAAVSAFLLSRGFQVIERAEDWRRDATAGSLAPLRPSPVAWEFRGIEALSSAPALFAAALTLLTETIRALPCGPVMLPIHPDTLRRRLRMQTHGVVALAHGTLQGLIAASPDDLMPAGARVNILAVRRDRRKQGLGTSLLARLLAQHADGAARFVTAGTPELTSWLTTCGFVQVADRVLLERLLRKTISPAREQLDEFVGRYVTEAPRGCSVTIEIERHGDSLVSKSRDMRDVLLAASDTEFFTRHHHGQGRFERDSSGRVVRLVCTEGRREFVAVRG
jgi:RNA polymerase sigma-70 factor (ECF subfamily)